MFDPAIHRRNFLRTTTLAAGSAWLVSRAGAEEKAKAAHVLSKLPYAFDALEPVIDARTMEIHHGKHHAAYVAGLNTALGGQPDLAGKPLEQILKDLPSVKEDAIRTALRNHGGGHWNHTFFWEIMAAPKKSEPGAGLKTAVESAFGSVAAMQEKFTEAAMKRFGSGWAWLVWQDGKLKITSTANQDNPFMKGLVPDSDLGTPVLGIDVWEHAYYLHYQNRRADYIKAWWDVVNWPVVSERFAAMVKGMTIHQLEQTQILPISKEEAWEFFSSPANLDAITPPDLGFRIITKLPPRMYEGQIIQYRVKLAPLIHVPWVTEIKAVDEGKSFIDEQRFGPYAFWHHRHVFEAVEGGVKMTDTVNYGLPFGPLGAIAHEVYVRRKLEWIFGYRRKILTDKFGVVGAVQVRL